MNAVLRRVLFVLVGLTGLTGWVFAFMKYWLTSDDPFVAFHHPWQPGMLTTHILAAPALLFTLGWVFAGHVAPLFNGTRHARLSGFSVIATIALMTASGYLLQVAVSPAWRLGYAWVHGVSGTLFLVLLAVHWASAASRAARLKSSDPNVSCPAA